MSDNKNTSDVVKAIGRVQSSLKPLQRNQKGHHGKYSDLQNVMEALVPLLTENKLTVIQTPSGDGGTVCTIETRVIHESGQEISGKISVPMQRSNDPQAYGASLTYARRYALMCMFGMVTEDDDAAAASMNLEKLLRGLSVCASIDDLNEYNQKCVKYLGDEFWRSVYTVLYRMKSEKLKKEEE